MWGVQYWVIPLAWPLVRVADGSTSWKEYMKEQANDYISNQEKKGLSGPQSGFYRNYQWVPWEPPSKDMFQWCNDLPLGPISQNLPRPPPQGQHFGYNYATAVDMWAFLNIPSCCLVLVGEDWSSRGRLFPNSTSHHLFVFSLSLHVLLYFLSDEKSLLSFTSRQEVGGYNYR
jgi:hypothetical protein